MVARENEDLNLIALFSVITFGEKHFEFYTGLSHRLLHTVYVAVPGRNQALFQNAIIEKNAIKYIRCQACTTGINMGQKAAARWILA